MRAQVTRVSLGLVLGLVLFTWSTAVTGATPETASVTFAFGAQKSEVSTIIESPRDISATQVILDIPEEVSITNVQLSGFLTGAMHFTKGREHRWFHPSASNQRQASLIITIAFPKGETPIITLLAVDLKGTSGNIIPIDTQLPAQVKASVSAVPHGPPQPPTGMWVWVGLGIAIAAIGGLAVVFRSPSRRQSARMKYLALLKRLSWKREVVNPRVVVSPASGPPRTTFEVRITGCTPNNQIKLERKFVGGTIYSKTLDTDRQGNCVTRLTLKYERHYEIQVVDLATDITSDSVWITVE